MLFSGTTSFLTCNVPRLLKERNNLSMGLAFQNGRHFITNSPNHFQRTDLILSLIGCDLSRRINRQGFVPKFKVDSIELMNFIQPYDVLKGPTNKDIDFSDGSQCKLKHVVSEPSIQDIVCLVLFKQGKDFIGDRESLSKEYKFFIKFTDLNRCPLNLCHRYVREDKAKSFISGNLRSAQLTIHEIMGQHTADN